MSGKPSPQYVEDQAPFNQQPVDANVFVAAVPSSLSLCLPSVVGSRGAKCQIVSKMQEQGADRRAKTSMLLHHLPFTLLSKCNKKVRIQYSGIEMV